MAVDIKKRNVNTLEIKEIAKAIDLYKRYMATKNTDDLYQGMDGIENLLYDIKGSGERKSDEKTSNFSLSSIYIIFLLEVDFKRAREVFSAWHGYRNFLKNEKKDFYYLYLYFSYRFGREKWIVGNTDKYVQALEAEVLQTKSGFGALLLGFMFFYEDNVFEACKWLQDAYFRGVRSPFLYMLLEKIFSKRAPIEEGKALLLPFLTWALGEKLPLGIYLEKNQAMVLSLFPFDVVLFEYIFKKTHISWLLLRICEHLTMSMDVSQKALDYYKECVNMQLDTPQINEFLIRAAAKQAYEYFNRYALGVYLKTYDYQIDQDLKPFIYHLILTKPDFSSFYKKVEKDIYEFGEYAADNGLVGRYYNSLYRHILEQPTKENSLLKAQVVSLLENQLFKVQLQIAEKDAAWLWVQEKNKNYIETYNIANQKVIINAVSEQFSYYAFTADDNIREVTVKRLAMVEGKDFEFLYLLYKAGIKSHDILMALSSFLVEATEISKDDVVILEKTAALSEIIPKFYMEIMSTLGFYYATEKNYQKAFKYYRYIKDNQISNKHVEPMILSYMFEKKYTEAFLLLQRKSPWINEKTLFFLVKELMGEKDLREKLAPFAYELLLKSRYEEAIFEHVLSHYKGSFEAWKNLSQMLLSKGITDIRLDRKILSMAMYTHTCNVFVEKTFIRMVKAGKKDSILENFSVFLSYQILIEDRKLLDQSVYGLESLLSIIEDENIGYTISTALSKLYIEKDTWTLDRGEVLKKVVILSKERGIFLPFLKKLRDKNLDLSYIERNQPFLYRTHKDRQVFLYYRPAGEIKYYKKPMEYFKFGVFVAVIPIFFDDAIDYYISEEMTSGNIITKEETFHYQQMNHQEEASGMYDLINNGLIFKKMFQYEKVETAIEKTLQKPITNSWIFIE